LSSEDAKRETRYIRSTDCNAIWSWAFILLSLVWRVSSKVVFAHFIASNTGDYSPDDWASDINVARDGHIEAFALNMAWNENISGALVDMAFTEAENLGFKLFFSFDYAGNGLWPASEVMSMLSRPTGSSAYFRH